MLLTDVVMPGMTGHELAQRVARAHPGLRVVFMSGHTEDVLVLDGAREREIAFVQKPFTRDTLLGAVAHALAERRRRSGGTPPATPRPDASGRDATAVGARAVRPGRA